MAAARALAFAWSDCCAVCAAGVWVSPDVAAVAANAAGATSTRSAARAARKRLTFIVWVRPPWRTNAERDLRAQACAFGFIRAAEPRGARRVRRPANCRHTLRGGYGEGRAHGTPRLPDAKHRSTELRTSVRFGPELCAMSQRPLYADSLRWVNVTLPDGTPLELEDGATGADAAAAIGPGLAKAALAVIQEDQ